MLAQVFILYPLDCTCEALMLGACGSGRGEVIPIGQRNPPCPYCRQPHFQPYCVRYSQSQIENVGKQAKELFALSTKADEEQVVDFEASAPPEALGNSKAEEVASLPSGD